MMPLSMASSGDRVKLVSVRAGWGLQRRLADLGLTPGVEIKVISSGRPGQVVLNVRGSRLALGHGVSGKIMVDFADKHEKR
jgi:ferrous iron transport protein A